MGQAKRKKEGNVRRSSSSQVWDSYLAKIVNIYLIYMMSVFVLICPQGFVQYDYYKRAMLYIGTIAFIILSFLVFLLSICNESNIKEYLKTKFNRSDVWMAGLLCVWTISYLGCKYKDVAFMGDSFRYIGFSSMMLTVISCWIVSKNFEFQKWMPWFLTIISSIIFVWQNLNYYGIDPLNWQMDGQYTHLQSCLGNVNQNAFFDALILSVMIGLFLLAKTYVEQILCGIAIFLGFMGGIAARSDTYYFGIVVCLAIVLGYALAHPSYLKKSWIVVTLFVISILIQKFGYNKILQSYVSLESITALLYQSKMILLMLVMVVALGIIAFFGTKWKENTSKIVFRIYLGVVGIIVLGIIGLVIYANKTEIAPESGSFLLNLKLNDAFGAYRGIIWKVAIEMFGEGNLFQKIFGYGFSNFSLYTYLNHADEVTVFGDQILADAHNIYLDLLVSSGLAGIAFYFGLIGTVFYKMIKNLKNVVVVCGIGLIASYLMLGLLNANLIVITPIFFMLLGCFWKISCISMDN